MKQKMLSVVVAVMLLTTVFGGTAIAQTTQPMPVDNETATDSTVENNTSEPSPGLQMAAMMGSIERDIGASLERFSMAQELRDANSTEEKQAIIDSYVDRQNEKMNKAKQNMEANASDNSTAGKYKSAMSVVDARNAASNAEFAQEQAEKEGVSVDKAKVDELRKNASEMSGQEVAALARSIGGPPAFAQNDDGEDDDQSKAEEKNDKRNGNAMGDDKRNASESDSDEREMVELENELDEKQDELASINAELENATTESEMTELEYEKEEVLDEIAEIENEIAELEAEESS